MAVKETKADIKKERDALRAFVKYVAYMWMAEHQDNAKFIKKLSILRKDKVRAEAIYSKSQELVDEDLNLLETIFTAEGVGLPIDKGLFNAASTALTIRTEEGRNGLMLRLFGNIEIAETLGVDSSVNRIKQ